MDAAPTAIPAIVRKLTKAESRSDVAHPSDDARKRRAVSISVFLRPNRLLRGPASTQPIMQPMMMQLTVQPLPIPSRLKTRGLEMYSITPEITEVSKPKRNPPVEATRQAKTRYGFIGPESR